jgi:Diacylglycerol kinase catalytic domain
MVLLLNLGAHGGRAAAKWRRVRPALERRSRLAVHTPGTPAELERAVDAALRGGEQLIVAGGGDGTVNAVLNAIMDPIFDRPRAEGTLGAIGLGSSNDFHKPFTRERRVGRVPVRVSAERARRVDVGRADMQLSSGERRVRYFLLNASVGLIAAGNVYATSGAPTFERLRRVTIEGAILWAGLRTSPASGQSRCGSRSTNSPPGAGGRQRERLQERPLRRRHAPTTRPSRPTTASSPSTSGSRQPVPASSRWSPASRPVASARTRRLTAAGRTGRSSPHTKARHSNSTARHSRSPRRGSQSYPAP